MTTYNSNNNEQIFQVKGDGTIVRETETRTCPKCKQTISAETKFCPDCGKKLFKKVLSSEQQIKRSDNILLIFICVFGVAVIIVSTFFLQDLFSGLSNQLLARRHPLGDRIWDYYNSIVIMMLAITSTLFLSAFAIRHRVKKITAICLVLFYGTFLLWLTM